MVVVSGLLACAPPKCTELPAPPAFPAQPLGGACVHTVDCAAGLECLPLPGSDGVSVCSRGCFGVGGCGAGACMLTAADAGEGVCLAACEGDGGCATGVHASRCVAGLCRPTFCSTRAGQPNDGCPSGSYCAGETCAEVVENGRVVGVGVQSGRCFVSP